MAPPYAITFMDFIRRHTEQQSFEDLVWWCYIDYILMMWEHGEEEFQLLSSYYEVYSRIFQGEKKILDVTVTKNVN